VTAHGRRMTDGNGQATTAEALQAYLHDRIPISKAMGIEVASVSADGVTLAAPLEPNINHRDTVFGGSASAVGILASWLLVYVRLRPSYPTARIVIQRNTVVFDRPITGRFTASSFAVEAGAWERFDAALARKSRARVHVGADLMCHGERVARLEASFVAVRQTS